MKKYLKYIALFLCVSFFAGCGGEVKEEVDVESGPVTETVSTESEPEPDPEAIEIQNFFDKYVDSDERPVAVMIDNDDSNARPHAGIEDAYIIYEIVVEGGATRFMAVFKGVNTEKIGPVRSSRHYFLDYALEHDAIYTHFGWSPKAMNDIPALGVKNINGILSSDESVFWRERKYKGDWHSAYTSIEKIRALADRKGYSVVTEHKNGICYSEEYRDIPDGKSAVQVKLAYSGGYNTGYTYNSEKKIYEKSINGNPHSVQSGGIVEVKNVIVQLIYDTDLGDGSARRNINTVGNGTGYYITNGAYEEITWSKSSRNGNTVYRRKDGSELSINPGKTAINIISPSAQITIN